MDIDDPKSGVISPAQTIETPQLYVAIANPLFAAPGCTKKEDTTVRECETEEAQDRGKVLLQLGSGFSVRFEIWDQELRAYESSNSNQEYLLALRQMLTSPDRPVRGISAYTVTTALVAYQAGVVLPLAGKAGRYLPHEASWQGSESQEALVARSRFLETAFGAAFRNLVKEFKDHLGSSVTFAFQQEAGTYLSYEALSKFRAVDLGLHKFTEHYAMGMPIWIPARESAYRLNMFVPWGMVQYSGSFRHGGPSLADETDRSGWGFRASG
eukprot:s1386_g2.t1